MCWSDSKVIPHGVLTAGLAIAALAVSGATAQRVYCQEVPFAGQVEEGDRVRFVAPPLFPDRSTGVLVSVDERLLHVDSLQAGYETVAIPLGNISLLEVSTGRKHKTWMGLGIGAVAGLAIGAGFVAMMCSDPDSGNCEIGETFTAVLIIAVPFAAVGGIVGNMIRPEQWEEVLLQ
jgi:hypothetical protein